MGGGREETLRSECQCDGDASDRTSTPTGARNTQRHVETGPQQACWPGLIECSRNSWGSQKDKQTEICSLYIPAYSDASKSSTLTSSSSNSPGIDLPLGQFGHTKTMQSLKAMNHKTPPLICLFSSPLLPVHLALAEGEAC